MSSTLNGLDSRYPRERIEKCLDRILASSTFAQAPILSRLLRYLVMQTLSGRAGELKEYSVGVEVLGRSVSFDPRTDTIVRVHARRLRSKLNEYYSGPGRADTIRIAVPKGHYAAHFQHTDESPATTEMQAGQQDVRRQRPPQYAIFEQDGAVHNWLAAPLTRLIGREEEMEAVSHLLLSDNGRLLTLTGAGGSGKTRLALKVAEHVADRFGGGLYFAALASITDPETVTGTLARILGLRQTGRKELVSALQNHLHFTLHAPALLLIDNFEQVLTAAPILVQLLEATPFLKILVTSRAVLHIYGEREYPVPPLQLPDTQNLPPVDELAGNPAVRLFMERATAVEPALRLTECNAQVIAEICSRLDGLPLAIELAAARAKVLPPAAMLARMGSRLDLLTGCLGGVPARQQTLRDTLEWSHQLLNSAEQKLFRRLAVFGGGCTLEGAEAVGNTRQDLGLEVSGVIESLCCKSLLQTSSHADGEIRFVMLETIREYAVERLRESGEEASVRLAHAAYFLVVAEESHPGLSSEEQQNGLALLDREHDNLRVALDWLFGQANREWALRFANALYWYWERREHLTEARIRLIAAVNLQEGQPPSAAFATAIVRAAAIAVCRDDCDSAFPEHQRALKMFRELGDRKAVAAQLDSLGATAQVRGDLGGACYWYEHSVRAYLKLGLDARAAAGMANLANVLNARGDRPRSRLLLHDALGKFAACGEGVSVAWVLNSLADVSRDGEDLTEARSLYNKALEMFRVYNDGWGVGRCLTDLGYLALESEDSEAAHAAFGEALETFAKVEHKRGIAKALEGAACVAVYDRQFERALTLAGAAAGLRQRTAAPLRTREQSRLDTWLAPAWHTCGAAAADLVSKASGKVDVRKAIDLALARNIDDSATGN
ncbi:MAG TPA: tetratricopeptide repeat protein [Bryobacteraceae bacterium]|nr:tetratricopeptide repeat protein [Bryobacteraceae bacterium]